MIFEEERIEEFTYAKASVKDRGKRNSPTLKLRWRTEERGERKEERGERIEDRGKRIEDRGERIEERG